MCICLASTAFADVNTPDKNAQLFQAAKDGNFSAVQTALADGADVNVKKITDGVTALMMASQNGHTEVVKLLLEKGADINVKASDGTTALWQASQRGYPEVVKLLLEKGADVNVKATINNVEWTALKIAKRMGRADIVQLLKKAGAKE